MASYILDTGVAEGVDFLPAAVSPFKINDPPAGADARIEMLRLGISDLCGSQVDRLGILRTEVDRPAPSYMVETLAILRSERIGERMGLLLGSDSFSFFHNWKNAEEIFYHHPLVIFMRTGDYREAAEKTAESYMDRYRSSDPEILILNNPRIDCSSTEIRAALYSVDRKNEIPGRCVPESILKYIDENRLYLK